MSEPIAITGAGCVSPLGETLEATCDQYMAGANAVRILAEEEFADLPVRLGARCACHIDRLFAPHTSRRLDRCTQLCLLAADQAWNTQYHEQHGWARRGIVFSSGIGGVSSLIEQLQILEQRGPGKVSPYTVGMLMANAPAAQLSLAYNASGWMETPVAACSGGAEAIARGVSLLRSGEIDVVIAGGAESILNRFGIAAFAAMQALSTSNGHPDQACRPFDQDRNGFVMAEGAGVVVLERLHDAEQRGATIHGVIRGIGCTADAHDIVRPRGDGLQASRAMAQALDDAGIGPEELQLVKAHATGTIAGDLAEAEALNLIFGELSSRSRPWLIAPKAVMGHLISASGPVELMLALHSLQLQAIPAQANCPKPEPVLPLRIPEQQEPLKQHNNKQPAALINSMGFGGRNVCLVIEAAPNR